jgi:hypothetical protein
MNVNENEQMNQFTTNDLSFAAYLMMRGCPLLMAKKLGKTFRFTLDLGEKQQNPMKIEYINSESAKFDASVRDLKKIMYSGG